jgi:hypothetical protein
MNTEKMERRIRKYLAQKDLNVRKSLDQIAATLEQRYKLHYDIEAVRERLCNMPDVEMLINPDGIELFDLKSRIQHLPTDQNS